MLVACSGSRSFAPGRGTSAAKAALLLPLTGGLAELGKTMAEAAGLVTGTMAVADRPKTYDAGDSSESATAAATAAIAAGASTLFGPLKAEQTTAVLAIAGKRPVVTFSNDAALAEQGAYVMGITPAQSLATMFTYAKAQGISRIAVLASDSAFGRATVSAAQQVAAAGGLTLTTALLRAPDAGGHLAAITAASGGVPPEAIYIPDGGAALTGLSEGLSGRGIQLMGSMQWSSGTALADGSWYAAPSPDLYQQFAADFRAAQGTDPGVIAALGYDAALVAAGLAETEQLNDKGLRRAAGFTGVLGPFRFTDDRRCIRDLAVLRVSGGATTQIAEIEGS
jgi:ABC-type branched-subunit amino acid transport system substrate-binding protein